MAAKGTVAKATIVKKLQEVFGSDYIGESGSKHYIWVNDGNAEKVQIAVSLTCPKTPIGTVDVSNAFGDGIDFTATPVVVETEFKPAEITQEEEDNLAAMMARLGL